MTSTYSSRYLDLFLVIFKYKPKKKKKVILNNKDQVNNKE